MKILITGCNGQLGTELRRILASGKTELGAIPCEMENAQVVGVDLPELDITRLSDVNTFMECCLPDVVINCAAYTNVNGCESNLDTAFAANAIGPRNLAIALEKTGAKLIHISTDYVFDGNGERLYSEWDLPNPQSVYGHTKLLGEQYVREFCRRYFIVRTSWLYGYVGGNFVKTILKAAKERGEIKVVDDQRGNPTNAADVAHHLLKLAVTNQYGLYHCTNNGECSWYDFASAFLKHAGIKCTVTPCTTEEFPTPAKRPAYSALDNRMLRCTVGDEMRDWQDAIAAYMTHYDGESGAINL